MCKTQANDRNKNDENHTESSESVENVRVDPLFVLEGSSYCVTVDLFKENICNTNIVWGTIVNHFMKYFDLKSSNIELSFAKKGFWENTTDIMAKRTVTIGTHR